MKKSKICLFAGYDADGIIDSYVVSYVKELAKFCDVYYLADSVMSEDELSKLAPYVKNAWSCRHGEYDFGSYARLLKNFVGWEKVAEYDDVLFVNDSCYLIKSLDDLFSDMDERGVDWWGLQATKGIAKTRFKKTNRFEHKINIGGVKEKKLPTYENEYFYDFLVGSYFLSFSKNVITSLEFKSFIDSISKEKNKLNIIRKYEIGLTRLLYNYGFSFDTYMKSLYPFHPIFTNVYFDMVDEGFPLLKRFFLTQNHYHVSNLHQWEDKLSRSCPEINLDEINENLTRVCEPDVLRKNLNIEKEPKFIFYKSMIKTLIKKVRYHHFMNRVFRKLRLKLRLARLKHAFKLYNPIFQLKDRFTKKDSNLWVFPTCAYDDSLTGNDLATFDAVKDNEELQKVILYRVNPVEIGGKNTHQYQIDTKQAKTALLKSGVVFIKHNTFVNTKEPLDGSLRKIICLWHGIPLKRIGCASLDFQNKLDKIKRIHSDYHSVICSSEIDRLAMTSAFQPLNFEQIWLTGLPRADFLQKPIEKLPLSIQDEIAMLEASLNGQKLVFFCPTFKNGQEASYYSFEQSEVSRLKEWLDKNNAVLGIREHMASKVGAYAKALEALNPLDLSSNNVVNIESIYKIASLLITDYSSAYIDFMLTDKPIISFAYDRDSYLNEERGLFYDFEAAMPGPICESFSDLMQALDKYEKNGRLISKEEYSKVKRMLYCYLDGKNAERLINKINES